jgi:hypothetical protein
MSIVNVGSWRVVILAALVVFGAVILSNGFSDGATIDPSSPTGATGGPTGPTGSPTDTPPPPPPEGQIEGVTFAVFNGTEEIGLAAEITLALEDAGYTSAQEAKDAPTTGGKRTTVYFRTGEDAAQNRANAQLLVDDNLPGARVRRLNPEFADLVPPNTQVVIVLGQDQVNPA